MVTESGSGSVSEWPTHRTELGKMQVPPDHACKDSDIRISSWHHLLLGGSQHTMDSGQRASQSAETDAIKTTALTRRFGDMTAVDHIDLRVPYGQIFGLLGPNGAGKSTTIKMLTTLLDPTSGTALVAGFDIVQIARRSPPENRLRSANAFRRRRSHRLRKSFALARSSTECPAPTATAASPKRCIHGLADAASKLVNTYSGGMIRRLELAQAMLHRPTVFFSTSPPSASIPSRATPCGIACATCAAIST